MELYAHYTNTIKGAKITNKQVIFKHLATTIKFNNSSYSYFNDCIITKYYVFSHILAQVEILNGYQFIISIAHYFVYVVLQLSRNAIPGILSYVSNWNRFYCERYWGECGMNVYIRNAEAACYGFEKNAECRLRCGLQLRTFLGRYAIIDHYCCKCKYYFRTS